MPAARKRRRAMIVKRNADNPDACANCGEKFGKLETPGIWQDHLICSDCYRKLSPKPSEQKAAPEIPLVECLLDIQRNVAAIRFWVTFFSVLWVIGVIITFFVIVLH
jgi:ribosomal protein L37AE/L43A